MTRRTNGTMHAVSPHSTRHGSKSHTGPGRGRRGRRTGIEKQQLDSVSPTRTDQPHSARFKRLQHAFGHQGGSVRKDQQLGVEAHPRKRGMLTDDQGHQIRNRQRQAWRNRPQTRKRTEKSLTQRVSYTTDKKIFATASLPNPPSQVLTHLPNTLSPSSNSPPCP